MAITAKVKLYQKTEHADGQVSLAFDADYADERNKEWAKYTPGLNLSMTVVESVGALFELGGAYTLTFEPSEE